jgi:hypothetical protein
VGVDHGQVERSQEEIRVGDSDEHGVVGSRVALEDLGRWLVGEARVCAVHHQRRVGEVQLRHPRNEGRRSGGGRSDIGVVGANSLTGGVPGEVHHLSREGQRLRAVARNGRSTAVASNVHVDARLISGNQRVAGVDSTIANNLVRLSVVGREAVGVGLVDDVKSRKVLPCETGVVLRARADVGSQIRPSPRLRDTGLEPDGHGMEAEHLAERHLLSSLGGNGLRKQLTDLSAVKVVDEAPGTTLTKAGELLVEVDEFANCAVGVVICALLRSSLTEHVAEKSSVTSLLSSHEGDIRAIFNGETSLEEVLRREDSEAVVEQIQLDPFLVQAESNRLEIEIAVDHVTRLSAVGAETTFGVLAYVDDGIH